MLYRIGDLLENEKEHYRVCALLQGTVVVCPTDINGLAFKGFPFDEFTDRVSSRELVRAEEDPIVFDPGSLTENVQKEYERNRAMVHDVEEAYEKDGFLTLSGRKHKPEVNEIIAKYGVSPNTFWRVVGRYFKCGRKPWGLIDRRSLSPNKGKSYRHTQKAGPKPKNYEAIGCVLTEEHLEHMRYGLRCYLKNRAAGITAAYNEMNRVFYLIHTVCGDGVDEHLVPENMRPSYKQFYNFVKENTTVPQVRIAKTSATEYRNNERPLSSNSDYRVHGPGDTAEADECESNVMLVSGTDYSRIAGRPIPYFMVDVYSRIILAGSVGYENNSFRGISNLFLNLGDDKMLYAEEYGFILEDPALWPSNVLPRRIRVDRGAEYLGNDFDKMCNELGIEKMNVPGGSGSYKGVVEQEFRQMEMSYVASIEGAGRVPKDGKGDYCGQAVLTIEEYTALVVNFIITHNRREIMRYRRTKEMIKADVRRAPVDIWKFGVEKYGEPRPITDTAYFRYAAMEQIAAKIGRGGIIYKGLYYFNEGDPYLRKLRAEAGDRLHDFKCRIDPRRIGTVYYEHDKKLYAADLQEKRTANGEFGRLTMEEWDAIRDGETKDKAAAIIRNQELSAISLETNKAIVAKAKEHKADNVSKKDVKATRAAEKQRLAKKDAMADRPMAGELPGPAPEHCLPGSASQPDDASGERKHYKSYSEAMDDLKGLY